MTMEHNSVQHQVAYVLFRELDRNLFRLRIDASRTRIPGGSYYVPDLFVAPRALEQTKRGQPETLETYSEPLPLVVEIWSRLTGECDVDSKLPQYRTRGDLEIWRIHPYEKNVTVWRRQPDGSYAESFHTSGHIEPPSLPGLRVTLSELFETDESPARSHPTSLGPYASNRSSHDCGDRRVAPTVARAMIAATRPGFEEVW